MSDKEKFLRRLEEAGESEVRSRVGMGNRSPYQRHHMDWAKEWIANRDRDREEAKSVEEASDRRERLVQGRISIAIGVVLALVALAGLYLGK